MNAHNRQLWVMSMNEDALENLHDRICYVILKAPDRFPSDTGMTLDKAFDEMYKNLSICYPENSSEYKSIKSLLVGSYNSYENSEQKQAILQLQTVENFIAGRDSELSKYP